jgi:hypothetical protein
MEFSYNASTLASGMFEDEDSCLVSRSSWTRRRPQRTSSAQGSLLDVWRMACLATWYSWLVWVERKCISYGQSLSWADSARFRIAPPLTISEEEIREGLAIMDEAFEFCLEEERSRDIADSQKVAP